MIQNQELILGLHSASLQGKCMTFWTFADYRAWVRASLLLAHPTRTASEPEISSLT
jgi:hypothetical protein